MRDSISLSVYYGAEVDLRGSLVLGLSQSGQTPDVLEYVERARARGAFTIAITNEPDSSLATPPTRAAARGRAGARDRGDEDLHEPDRRARAPRGLRRRAGRRARGRHPPHGRDLLEELLPALERRVAELASSLAFVGRMFVIGRGTEFATAREISLKLLETCRVAAEPLTATDLIHGPVAAIDGLFPVWTIASADESLPAVREAAARARAAGAMLIASGTGAHEIAAAEHTCRCRRRRCRSSRRCSRSRLVSSSRGPWPRPGASTRTRPNGLDQGHARRSSYHPVTSISAIGACAVSPLSASRPPQRILQNLTTPVRCASSRLANWYIPIAAQDT